jgi:hypothetical protein
LISTRLLAVVSLGAGLIIAAGKSWKDEPPAQWTEEDAKQILTDSPWAMTVQPTIDRSNNEQRPRRGGGRGGIGLGGIGIGMPGGMGRRGGMGYPGDRSAGESDNGANRQPPTLHIRWESALPVREAELKARETTAPTVDEGYYAIAVYGVPERMANGDPKTIGNELKKQAAIKREGKKDLKPSSVEVLQREDGPVIVYVFPRSAEITAQDKRLDFHAKIMRLELTQSFYPDQMTYQGKLEL